MAHPNGALFAWLPGAGAVTVPRLIVALGTHRESYDSAFEVQCYSGIASVKESSGKTGWVHFRRTCPTFLRQTFHELLFIRSANRSGPFRDRGCPRATHRCWVADGRRFPKA